MSAAGESPDTVGFGGVAGWERRTTGDRGTAVLRGPSGVVLLVTVANGVEDFERAARWRREMLGLQAFDAEFDGGAVTNPGGFHGYTCKAVQAAGVCAVVGKDNLVVTVALAGRDATPGALAPIVDSLRVAS
ncbi:hypothetical protein D5S18_12070 [Nocardia panacis]|uniref:Uncharacterized protein n=1 Tax=Nocardia panacis TaxID=2340916 RepID=A0A3A4KN02_9NOCA|nr:hypothetical protein D5S18_12070 [Nocardia panacis]